MIDQITINFKSEILPAPFAHTCTMDIKFENEKIYVNAKLLYIDRQHLTEEEIWEEGFSGEDDFIWEGEIYTIWKGYLCDIANSETDLKESSNNQGETIEVKIKRESEQVEIQNHKRWVYVMQELLQAIYEINQFEEPLTIQFKEINNTESNLYKFIFLFKSLETKILLNKNNTLNTYDGNWNECRNIIKEVFIPDYQENKILVEEPKSPGMYVDPGEGVWYNSSDGIKIGKKSYNILNLKNLIESIIKN